MLFHKKKQKKGYKMTTKKSLKNRHKPESEAEMQAIENVYNLAGCFAECANCMRCKPDCSILDEQYESELFKQAAKRTKTKKKESYCYVFI